MENVFANRSSEKNTAACDYDSGAIWTNALVNKVTVTFVRLRRDLGSHILTQSPARIVGHTVQTVSAPESFREQAGYRDWWWKAVLLVLLIGWLYFSIVVRLVNQWWMDPNFSHGFFVPSFAVFVAWQDRHRLRGLRQNPSWWGLGIIALALCALIIGVLGAELFFSRISLIFLLAGLTVFFWGWDYLRALAFPWAFLFLMIPIPAIVFNQITFPLQILASKVAAHVLPLAGVPVLREGNIINLPAMPLEVAQACSGIRSLLSLTTLSIIYGYLAEPRNSIRVILTLASIPIAVAANSLRIVGTGLLVQYWEPDKAEGFFHTFSGWLIFVASLLMLFLLHRALLLFFKTPGEEHA